MPSKKKNNKIKNRFLCKGALKNKKSKCKGILFYTTSERKKKQMEYVAMSAGCLFIVIAVYYAVFILMTREVKKHDEK